MAIENVSRDEAGKLLFMVPTDALRPSRTHPDPYPPLTVRSPAQGAVRIFFAVSRHVGRGRRRAAVHAVLTSELCHVPAFRRARAAAARRPRRAGGPVSRRLAAHCVTIPGHAPLARRAIDARLGAIDSRGRRRRGGARASVCSLGAASSSRPKRRRPFAFDLVARHASLRSSAFPSSELAQGPRPGSAIGPLGVAPRRPVPSVFFARARRRRGLTAPVRGPRPSRACPVSPVSLAGTDVARDDAIAKRNRPRDSGPYDATRGPRRQHPRCVWGRSERLRARVSLRRRRRWATPSRMWRVRIRPFHNTRRFRRSWRIDPRLRCRGRRANPRAPRVGVGGRSRSRRSASESESESASGVGVGVGVRASESESESASASASGLLWAPACMGAPGARVALVLAREGVAARRSWLRGARPERVGLWLPARRRTRGCRFFFRTSPAALSSALRISV